MRDWHLTASDPLVLRVAADARLGPTDYADDQIWELTLAGSEPPALALRTSYGLRAREMRLFPIFAEGPTQVTDPAEFVGPPEVRAVYPNYLRVAFEPLSALAVTAHYWIPDSHTVAGRFTLLNGRPEPRRVRVSLAALFRPSDNPRLLSAVKADEFLALTGHTGNLEVAVVLEAAQGDDTAPHPALWREVELLPNEPMFIRWVQVTCPDPATPPAPVEGESLWPGWAGVRRLFHPHCEWDGEFARVELHNAGLLEIETGDPDWDAALALAQTTALLSVVGPTAHLPHPSFVLSRHPDRGYSRRGDGSDYNWQWDGQTAFDAYGLLMQIVAAAPELAKGILKNFLAVQEPSGFIDWKPGLAGQRNRALCAPLLATLAWKIYAQTEDRAFVAEVYPALRRFLEVWFTPRHDRDEDGFPEWTHTLQAGFDDHPSFSRWHTWAQGADISQVEAPDLAAYLCAECESLRQLAACLPADSGVPAEALAVDLKQLADRAEQLKARVNAMWREGTALYHYIDRDTHEVLRGKVLATGRGNLVVDLHRKFAPAARLLVKVVGPKEARPDLGVTLSGRGRRGRHRVEELRRAQVQWFWGVGTAASEKVYAEVERIEVSGLSEEYEVRVAVVDCARQDQTLLAPLWAGLPDAARAETLVRRTLLDPERFWRPGGVPACSAQDAAYQADNREGCGGVWSFWNGLIGEGLVRYGYYPEAAGLLTRLMAGIVAGLKNEKTFRAAYNAETLEGLGDRSCVSGLAPVGLFMQVVGVRIISPRRVWVAGRNPFPWPVTIRHKGVTVVKEAAGTRIIFPSGRTVPVPDAAAQFVEDSPDYPAAISASVNFST